MDYFDKIDDYINGKLSESEVRDFEVAMQSDAALRFAVEEYETGSKLSEALLEVDMANTLAGLRKDHVESPIISIKKKRNVRPYLIAASFAGLLALGTYLVLPPNQAYTQEQILAQYYRPPIYDMERTVNQVDMTPLEAAKYQFHAKEYKDSEQRLLSVLSNENTSVDDQKVAQYYLGHVYLLTEEYDKATTFFRDSGFGDWAYQVKVVKCLQDPGECGL